jgi:hypothetical protein
LSFIYTIINISISVGCVVIWPCVLLFVSSQISGWAVLCRGLLYFFSASVHFRLYYLSFRLCAPVLIKPYVLFT